MGTTAAQKKLFFNLRKVKNQIKAVEEGDLHPDNVAEIATRLNVSEEEVVNMNRRLAAHDHSLNAPLKADTEGEWQDFLVDEETDQETLLAEQEELDNRRGDAGVRDGKTKRSRKTHLRRTSDEGEPLNLGRTEPSL